MSDALSPKQEAELFALGVELRQLVDGLRDQDDPHAGVWLLDTITAMTTDDAKALLFAAVLSIHGLSPADAA